jgi:hypothetical protein
MPNSPILECENTAPTALATGTITVPSSIVPSPVISERQGVDVPTTPTVAAEASRDFINAYGDYADVLEVPRTMHEAVAIQIVASILNKNGVVIPHGTTPLSLDLWLLLLSGSGCGRSTLTTLARPILQEAQIEGLIRNTQWGSPEGLYQDMAENPSGLFIWGEFSEKMRMFNDPRFGGAKIWLTDRFDNFVVPEVRKYRQTNKPQSTPSISFDVAPRINILATSSDAWFFSHLSEEDSAGGFVPRWMIARADGEIRDVPIPKAPDASLVQCLAVDVAAIDALRGEADLSLVAALHEAWYSPTKARFSSQANSALAMAYFNRHRAHILKLAVIFEASASRSLRVTPQSWERAVKFAKMLEDVIFSMLGTGMNAEGHALKQMEDKIREAGKDGISQSQLTRAFQHVKLLDRRNRLETLVESGLVREKEVKSGGGRPSKIFTHSYYLAQRDRMLKAQLEELMKR